MTEIANKLSGAQAAITNAPMDGHRSEQSGGGEPTRITGTQDTGYAHAFPSYSEMAKRNLPASYKATE